MTTIDAAAPARPHPRARPDRPRRRRPARRGSRARTPTRAAATSSSPGCREAGLEIAVDRIGNIFGIWNAADAAPVMIGSHIDTVIDAGIYDGCYGVLAGLEVIETLKGAGFAPARPIAVAAFTNEEGVRYAPDMMGSLVHAGGLSVEAALATVGTDGSVLGARARTHRLRGRARARLPRAARLSRAACRAGAGARSRARADRRGREPAGHLVAARHHRRRRQPCRHDADVDAPGRRPCGRPRGHVPARPRDGLEHADGRDGRLHAASSRTPSTSFRRARPSRSTCAIPTSSACRPRRRRSPTISNSSRRPKG